MSKRSHRSLSAEEQHILEQGQVRLLERPQDLARCDELITQHHYLKGVSLVGEHLRYAFVYRGDEHARFHRGMGDLPRVVDRKFVFGELERDQFVLYLREYPGFPGVRIQLNSGGGGP